MEKDNKLNLFIIILPTLLCILVFFLPNYVQNLLTLNLAQLNVWSWFTSSFVHFGFQHIFMNLLLYLFFTLFAYFIIPDNERKKFYILIILLIIIVPLITFTLISYLRYIGKFPESLIFQKGFSAISSSSLGILGISISKKLFHIFNKLKERKYFFYRLSGFTFFPAIFIMTWPLSALLGIIILIFWILLTIEITLEISKQYNIHRTIKTLEKKEKLILIPCLFMFLFGASFLIPVNPLINGAVTNSLAHLTGFVVGYVSTYIFLRKAHNEKSI